MTADETRSQSAPTALGSGRMRVAVLISGRGSNMQSLVAAARAPDYPADVCLVVSDKLDAAGLDWARGQGVPVLALDYRDFADRTHFESQLNGVLQASRVELVCLAGFMRLLSARFVETWHNRLINIHPSLLPAFRGLDTHARAIESGVKVSGCTVHMVRPKMDEGPILGQAVVPVRSGDTPGLLAARVLAAEHRLYPRILELFATGTITVNGDLAVYSQPVAEDWVRFEPALD